MKFFSKIIDVIFVFVIVFSVGIMIFWDRSEFKIKDLASISDISISNKAENNEIIDSKDDFTGTGVADPISTKEDLQDILDDIAEKLDIIQAEVDDLLIEENVENKKLDEESLKEEVEQEEDDEDKKEIESSEKINYLKVLISEVRISPINERFIKLFNPNSVAIDLTDWYLQRKTATGSDFLTCISKNDFEGKIILPNNYIIISKQDLTLTENNYLFLKNPNGEISDSFRTEEMPVVLSSGGGNIAEVKSCVGQININTADIEKLKELTGIGDAKARAIIDARPFSSVDDLLRVSGIGQATLQKIKDQNCAYVENIVLPILKAIKITNLPIKTSYFVGENLDITGLVVIGKYVILSEDGEIPVDTKEIPIAKENITGFDSSVPISEQILTINYSGFTAEYGVEIIMSFKILSSYPIDNSVNVPVDINPILTFSEELDIDSLKSSNLQLREYAELASDAEKVPAVLTLSQNGTVVGFYLSKPLEYSKQYYFFVGSGVKNISGKSIFETWYHADRDLHEFTTLIETTSPSN